MDLASGKKEPWEIRAEIESLNSVLLMELDSDQRHIIEIKINELLGELGDVPSAAQGGITELDLQGGGASSGPGTGTSDSIPAKLSDGEFVMTANAVKNFGGGNRHQGAKKMYQMMNTLDPNSEKPSEAKVIGG